MWSLHDLNHCLISIRGVLLFCDERHVTGTYEIGFFEIYYNLIMGIAHYALLVEVSFARCDRFMMMRLSPGSFQAASRPTQNRGPSRPLDLPSTSPPAKHRGHPLSPHPGEPHLPAPVTPISRSPVRPPFLASPGDMDSPSWAAAAAGSLMAPVRRSSAWVTR